MKIGVFFTASKSHGGVYQYSLAVLESLSLIKGNSYTVFTTSPDIPREYYRHKSFKIINLNSPSRSFLEKIRNFISLVASVILPKFIPFLYRNNLFWLIMRPDKLSQRGYIKKIQGENLDFMIYTTSSNLSFLTGVPSAVAIHDLAHRLYPQFPEVSSGGRWEIREYSFSAMTQHGCHILVDSKIGKEDVLNCYPKTKPDNVIVLPFLPPSYLDNQVGQKIIDRVEKKYGLTKEYFYYPANFWTHKHHSTLIAALKLCRDRGYNFSLAFTGNKKVEFSVYDKVMRQATELGLSDYVKYLGYVDSEEISALYVGSKALVMPTNFGPSNIPVLEAWALDTPVIYSNVRGCKEQLGNAGISIDPTDPQKWATAMIKMATNKPFAQTCIKNGKTRLSQWTQEDFSKRISSLIAQL